MDSPESDTFTWPWRVAVLLGTYCLIGGVVSLSGWIFDLPDLTDWSGTGISIQPNAALAVAVAGASILLLNFGFHLLSLALGVFVFLAGASSVLQIATDIDLGINTILMFEREWGRGGVLSPGRMGTPGATSWTLFGAALVLANIFLQPEKRARLGNTRLAAAIITLITLTISGLSIVGYAFGAQTLYTVPLLTVIALQTATFIFAASTALILSVREAGPMRLILDDGPAGALARRIIPAVILVPLILGFVGLIGQQAGLHDLAFGAAIQTVVEIVLLLALLWWTTVAVRRQVSDLKTAEEAASQSEVRFLRFMERLPGLAWIKDAQGKYIFTNDAAAAAFGMPAGELYGKTDQEIFPPEMANSFVDNDNLALSNGKGLKTVEELVDASGVLKYSLVNKFPIAADNGQTLVGGIAIDITEQREAQRNQEFLFSASEMIRTSTGPDALLSDIASSLGKFLNVHRCLFNEIDLEHDVETVRGDYSRDGSSVAGKHKITDYSSITSATMAEGKTVVNRDSKADPRTADLFDKTYGPAGERSYVAVPMLQDGRWVASLWCSDDRTRNWTDQEVALVENVAERTWGAVTRARADQALLENDDRLAFTLESARGGDWDLDLLTGKAVCSFRHDQCFGATEPIPDWSYEKFLTYVHPDDRGREDSKFQAAVASGKDWAIDCRVVWPDGSIHWIESSGRNYRYVDGKPTRMLGMVREVSDAKRREANLAFLVEVSQDLVQLTNIEDTMNALGAKIGGHFNGSLCTFAEIDTQAGTVSIQHDWHREDVPCVIGEYRISDYATEEISRAWSAGETFVVADTREDPRVVAESAAALKIASYITVPIFSAGEWRFVLSLYDSVPREWHDEEIELMQELATRIWTRLERARAEEALTRSEEKYRNLFDSIDEGFCIIEMIYDDAGKPIDYRFVEINPAFEKQTGIERAEGRRMREIAPLHEDHWFEIYGRVAETGEAVRFENRAEQLNRRYDVFASRVGDDGSRRVAIVFNDITERRRSEETLRQSYDEMNRFNELMVGRELRMIELKKEINELCLRHGEAGRYPLEFERNGDEG